MYGQTKSIENHIVLLGWSERTKTLITALRSQAASLGLESRPILVVTPNTEVGTSGDDRIYFVFGNPTDASTIKHANLEKAHLVFIPQGESGDIEALTALLGILALRPHVRVCVELSGIERAEVVERLVASGQLGSQVEVVSSEQILHALLRHALEIPGAVQLFVNLLTPAAASSSLQRLELPLSAPAQTYRALSETLFNAGAVLVAYSSSGVLVVNPPNREQLLQPGDVAWIIAPTAFKYAGN